MPPTVVMAILNTDRSKWWIWALTSNVVTTYTQKENWIGRVQEVVRMSSLCVATTYVADGASDSTSQYIPNKKLQSKGWILSLVIGANDASWRKIKRRWVAYEVRNVIWREKNCSRWCKCAISHSCQMKARKVGLELGQSTSLLLACLEMEMDY